MARSVLRLEESSLFRNDLPSDYVNPKNLKKLFELPPGPPLPGTAWITLTNGKFALVDQIDADFLLRFCWNEVPTTRSRPTTFYARTNVHMPFGRTTVEMHTVVAHRMGLVHPDELDHKNRHGWVNTRVNLRPATFNENRANATPHKLRKEGYTGVRRQGGVYEAYLHGEYVGSYHAKGRAAGALLACASAANDNNDEAVILRKYARAMMGASHGR
jgi:hypothetical protein